MSRSILITGAARGLGLCFAKKYLKDGFMVFAGTRDLEAPKLKDLQREYPNAFLPVELEVTDTESVAAAARTVRSYTEKLDLIINNAAVHNSTSFEVLEKADLDDCLKVYDINSLGPLRVVKGFLPFLRNNPGAKVINISSESGSISTCGREKEFDYCMSKAALNMASKMLSNYLRKDQIIVLAVHPGWMRTDMGGGNAALDPYETACKLAYLFETRNDPDGPGFIDNQGNEYPW